MKLYFLDKKIIYDNITHIYFILDLDLPISMTIVNKPSILQ